MALNDVPLSGQTLAATRNPINQNFSLINTAFLVDHVEYNISGAGKHNKITFPVQAGAPTYAAGEEGLYNLSYNNGTTTINELFVHKQTSSGTQEIPFTSSIISQNAAVGNNTAGWTYLPSGVLLRWESPSGGSGGLITTTLSPGYPAFNAIFTVILTPSSTSTSDVNFEVRFIDILSTTQFRFYVSNRTTTGAFSSSWGARALIIGR